MGSICSHRRFSLCAKCLRRKVFDPNTDLYVLVDPALRSIAREFEITKKMAERLEQLRNFEIAIVCDDSGSMKTPIASTKCTRWDQLRELVKIVIKIGVIFDSNGVDIYFLNRDPYLYVKDPATVDRAFEEPPSGMTPLVPVLKKIFKSKLASEGREKKLLVLVTTDGVPTDDDGNECIPALERVLTKRRNKETTHVSFLLCTDEPYCIKYLLKWDEQMKNLDVTQDYHMEKARIQKCKGNDDFKFSYGDYIVKALIGSIDRDMDALNEPF